MTRSDPVTSIFFLINAKSGGKAGARIFSKLCNALPSLGSQVCVETFDFSNLAAQVKRAQQFDIVVLGGGDGTISRTLPLFKGGSQKIGILPLGTGNDLARELNLLRTIPWENVHELVNFYRKAKPLSCSMLCLEHGPQFSHNIDFINYVSFGFDAKVVSEFSRIREQHFWTYYRGVFANRLAYTLASLRCISHGLNGSEKILVKGDQGSISLLKVKSLIFANIQSMMGIGKSNTTSALGDRLSECIVVKRIWDYLGMITKHKCRFLSPKLIGISMEWEINNIPLGTCVQIDGEPRPEVTSTTCRIKYSYSLNLLIGQS